MKKTSLEIIKGFFAVCLNDIPILLVVFLFYAGILKREPVWWKYFLLGVIPFLFFLIRYYQVHLAGFFALHIGIVGCSYFLAESLDEKIIFMLMGILFFGLSIYTKVVKKQAEDLILFAAMTFVIAFITYFAALSGVGQQGAYQVVTFVIVYIILYLLYQYFKGFLEYIRNNEISTKNIPKKHIFLTGSSAMAGFLIVFVGCAALIAKGNLFSNLIYKIRDLIERFLIWLLSLAPEGMEQGTKVEETVEEVNFVEGLQGETENVQHLPEELVKAIDYIVTIGAYVISLAAILLLAYLAIRAIQAAFRIKREQHEEENILPREKVTKLPRKPKLIRAKEKQISKERKIRKLYEDLIVKKTIQGKSNKHERKALLTGLKYKTPLQQCDSVQEKETIHILYEKARYSGKEITKEDLRQMRTACIKEGKNSLS